MQNKFLLLNLFFGLFIWKVFDQIKFFITLFILLFIQYESMGQECLDYPDIEGAPCTNCVPTGWTTINSPDMGGSGAGPSPCVDNIGVSGPSPSGGNFVSMCTNNAGYSEGMSRIFNNLTPCQSYTFGIWWEETIWCNVWNDPGTLLITVQGQEFIFTGATTWELAQVCFTAQSTSVEISVRAFFNGVKHCLIVDGSPTCSELAPCPAPEPCCTLDISAEDSHEICPGTSINLNGLVQNPMGNIQVEWTSIPANGITFLNDINALNPVFAFPSGNFEGETFTFLLTVTDEICTKTTEVVVNVLKSELPTFDFSVCELSDPDVFPNISDNGYEGTWSGNFNFPALAGTNETYTFSLLPNEENCIREANFDIEIIEANNVLFDLETSYCVNDDNLYILPTTSQDLVNGSWDITEFIPAVLGTGIFNFQFSPESQFCALPYSHSIFIKLKPVFDTLFCNTNQVILPDPQSANGLIGFWNPPVINPSDFINNEFISIWNPQDPLSSCVTDWPVTFILQDPTPLTFNLADSLCLNSGIYNLPPTSLEAISGQWNIAEINTNLFPEGTINLTFSSSEFCTQDFDTSIELKAEKSPVFDIKTDICESTTAFILPNTSLDGITGSWSQPIIDPSIIQSGFTSTFTPDNAIESCFLPVSVVFQITTTIIPSFDFHLIVCATDGPMIFPTVSKNGVTGSWTSMVIDFSSIDSNYIRNTFTPSIEGCEESVDIIIDIVKLDKPTVELVHPGDCNSADGSIILTGSVVGKEFSIDGTLWTSNTRFDSLQSGQFMVYQRSVLNTSCFDSMVVELISPDYPEILQVEVTEISSCIENNGKVICSVEGENVEYSINGFTWQSSPVFENLGPSVYTIQVRNRDKINCKDQATFTIQDIINTTLADVIVSPVTDCGKEDGNIFITASGDNLEYSIDGGQNFFISFEFFNLAAGQYNIVIQSTIHSDCDVDTIVHIDTPLFPGNLVLVKTDVSACDVNDGSIVVSATGISLEYSIDGGFTWSNDSIFNGLSANEYEVVVREKNHVNCVIKQSILLKAADAPKLLNQNIIQPSTCISDDGSITLEINFLNIEYSIDGGINWQNSNQFSNLSEGSYTIVFRQINTLFCQSEVAFDIINPPCPCNGLNVNFDITEVNCKDMSTGQISVNQITGYISSDTINFMWENGSNDYTLSNLAEGWYSYTIHYDKNCTLEDSVFLSTIDPFQFGLKGFDVTCDSLGSIEVHDLQGGSGQFLFSNNALSFQENSTFFNLTANDYEIIVKDILGCEEADRITIGTINNLSLELPLIKPVNKGSSIVLNPLINQSTIDSFTWTPNKYILNPGSLIAEVAPPVTTEYLLTIYFGACAETRSVIVEVIANDKLFIPNIISLNSTGNNNRFYFFGNSDNDIQIEYYKFYDRWGNLIYHIDKPEINNSDHGWDGTMSGRNVEQGVYLYLSALKINGEQKLISGSLTVIK